MTRRRRLRRKWTWRSSVAIVLLPTSLAITVAGREDPRIPDWVGYLGIFVMLAGGVLSLLDLPDPPSRRPRP